MIDAARRRLLSILARQFGRPHGLLGHAVVGFLDRGNRRPIAAAVEAARLARGGVAADIGFGGGVGLSLLVDHVGESGVVHGIDIAEDMLARARSRFAPLVKAGRLRLASGSLTDLPLDDCSVDAAITVNTLYYVEDLAAACAELARVVRPGGRAVIGIYDPTELARVPVVSYGYVLRPVADIVAALKHAGFAEVEHNQSQGRPMTHHTLVGRPPD